MDAHLERFLRYLEVEKHHSPNTLAAYQRDLTLFSQHLERPLEEARPHDVSGFVARQHARGLSPRSLARMLSSIRRLYTWLEKRQVVSLNPAANVSAPKARKALPKALDTDQAARLFEVGAAVFQIGAEPSLLLGGDRFQQRDHFFRGRDGVSAKQEQIHAAPFSLDPSEDLLRKRQKVVAHRSHLGE